MSMSGRRRLELERARQEALRLEQVRDECEALLTRCEQRAATIDDVATQQLAGPELGQVGRELLSLRDTLADAPDEALKRARALARRQEDIIATAEGTARPWSERQAELVALTRAVEAETASLKASEGLYAGAEVGAAARLATEALDLARRGLEGEASAKLDEARAAATTARTAALDERTRRAVVKGLLKTLRGMGFVVASPTLSDGTVTLEGRLASGRRARFSVELDGEMEFDLDGYEGRACAQDMEKVETIMCDRFGVKLGPPQVVWKNPDRLTKGARDLPGGGSKKGGR